LNKAHYRAILTCFTVPLFTERSIFSNAKKEPFGSFLLEMSMKLFVGSGTLGLVTEVSRPDGRLEAGASGVATSFGVVDIRSGFAQAGNTVVVAINVGKLPIGADHHESAFVVTCVDACLEGVVA
jgi:hypothetical protein